MVHCAAMLHVSNLLLGHGGLCYGRAKKCSVMFGYADWLHFRDTVSVGTTVYFGLCFVELVPACTAEAVSMDIVYNLVIACYFVW